ncbi:hypothetical protein ACFQXA_32045 [Nocardiopsis composta]
MGRRGAGARCRRALSRDGGHGARPSRQSRETSVGYHDRTPRPRAPTAASTSPRESSGDVLLRPDRTPRRPSPAAADRPGARPCTVALLADAPPTGRVGDARARRFPLTGRTEGERASAFVEFAAAELEAGRKVVAVHPDWRSEPAFRAVRFARARGSPTGSPPSVSHCRRWPCPSSPTSWPTWRGSSRRVRWPRWPASCRTTCSPGPACTGWAACPRRRPRSPSTPARSFRAARSSRCAPRSEGC